MDLMTLAAKIELDDSSYTKGVKNAESMGKQLAGKMSAMTVAVGNIAADMIRKGVNAISSVVTGAMDGFADYQQLIGGVETLFKQSANKVAAYAKQSYKTTGLSANQYMETVTSFSASLLQGLGGDTEQAAELANLAITDMADNANKMGTDISSIQAAYQGFAKQNYTMLDNLKLGYGGTASEMIRLINDSKILDKQIDSLDGITFNQLIAAIHKVQTELGITGTTAEEAAGTLEGSKNAMKAAWEDLLSAIGGEGDKSRLEEAQENFKSSFGTYMENFIPTLTESIANSGSLVMAIAESIASLPTDLLSKITEGGLEAGAEAMDGVTKVTSWLIDSLVNMLDSATVDNSSIVKFATSIGDFIGTALGKVVTNAPTILNGIIAVGEGLAEGLVTGLFEGLFGKDAEVDKITDQMEDDLTKVNMENAKASALVKYIRGLADEFGSAATETSEFKDAVGKLEEYIPNAGKIFESYGEDVEGACKAMDTFIQKMKATAMQAGIMKALESSYELLGEQTARRDAAQALVDTHAESRDAYQAAIIESLKAYAQEYLNQNRNEDGSYYEYAESVDRANLLIEKGLTDIGGEVVDVMSLNADQMKNLADYWESELTYGQDETPVWAKNLADNILDPKELSGLVKEIAKENAEILTGENEVAKWQKEIDATQENIAPLEQTAVRIAEESAQATANAWDASSDTIQAGSNTVADAFFGLAAKVTAAMNSITMFGGFGGSGGSGSGGSNFPSWLSSLHGNAKGNWNVPVDNFPALLHAGEMVLTRSQARQYRGDDGNGGINPTDLMAMVRDGIRAGMQGATVRSYLNGRDITDEVNRNSLRTLKARRFA